MAEIPFPQYWDPSVMQQALSPLEKDLRERFVVEYVKDYDPVAACVRIGFMKGVAVRYGHQFLDEPFVQQLLDKHERQQTDPKVVERNIRALAWKEANSRGEGTSQSARIAALSLLADLHGLKAPTKIKAELSQTTGVFVVPAIASLEDWEKAAANAQERLMANVRH